MKPTLRNGIFHLRRRVPIRFASVEQRKEIWISLKTDSQQEARGKMDAAWQSVLAAWEARLAGKGEDADAIMESARNLAQQRGFRYLPLDRVAQLPIMDIVRRMEQTVDKDGQLDPAMATAVLGTAKPAKVRTTSVLGEFFTLSKDRIRKKSDDQIRRWKNPREKAFKKFVEVVGDVDLAELSQDDMLDYRDALWERIEREEILPDSANKEIGHIAATMQSVNLSKRLSLTLPLDGLRFKVGRKNTRPSFSSEWIKTRILAPGALSGMNKEARCILLGMINTGYRLSEGAALREDGIRLDTEIPYIHISEIDRQLKTAHSDRIIPLAGASLQAFQQCPTGFPTYFDNPSLSATINKFLKTNGLKETETTTAYSLRHSFEDRLLDADVDERIRRDLMGHALNRERYGKGANIEKLAQTIDLVAF